MRDTLRELADQLREGADLSPEDLDVIADDLENLADDTPTLTPWDKDTHSKLIALSIQLLQKHGEAQSQDLLTLIESRQINPAMAFEIMGIVFAAQIAAFGHMAREALMSELPTQRIMDIAAERAQRELAGMEAAIKTPTEH